MSTAKTLTDRRSRDAISGSWHLDPQHSIVEFHVPHLWGLQTVKGHFDDYDGHFDLRANPAIELTIDAGSLETGNPKRDKHLRSDDFFDAENNPQVRFVSDSVEPEGDKLKVRGRLSAHGRSIPLEFDAEIEQVDDGDLEIEATATAPHHELGMTWSPLGMIRPQSELVVKGHLIKD